MSIGKQRADGIHLVPGYRNENDILSPRSASDTILQGAARMASMRNQICELTSCVGAKDLFTSLVELAVSDAVKNGEFPR
jgi:hypothetical protein